LNAALTVAVVGSGPSGFYASAALLDLGQHDVHVDMYERLPTPWGLVRAGVAPDHPKIKSVSAVYDRTAAHPRFRYFGNVEVGRQVTRQELTDRYDAVIYAVGAQDNLSLGIPGEQLPGSVAAANFVGWYNGHPDHAGDEFDLAVRRAVVIGNGNVALDVARILCGRPDRLARTDIADHALDKLRAGTPEEVMVIGRRGPAQAAFTTPELKELAEFTRGGVDVDPSQVQPDHGEDRLPKQIQRNLAVLRAYASQASAPETGHIALRFLRSPVELRGEGRVEEIVLGVNQLNTSSSGQLTAVDTGVRQVIETGLVIRAVGYRGLPISGLPYDKRRGIVPNSRGRVDGTEREYVVGWIKRGPIGIIGTNKKCAAETVARLAEDLRHGSLRPHDGRRTGGIDQWLAARQPALITQERWELIDRAERAAGQAADRPRIKLCTTEELLSTAIAGQAT
jgi:ferredoxin/flavodoxin---NADP+ reductase